jgi:hypothetical protein
MPRVKRWQQMWYNGNMVKSGSRYQRRQQAAYLCALTANQAAESSENAGG